MNAKWVTVDYDEIQVGDRIRDESEINTLFEGFLISGFEYVDREMYVLTESDMFLDKKRLWQRKLKEQPMNTDTDTDTDETAMYNVWDQDGIWVGIQRGIVNHVRLYTYELIPKSDYPKMPIADGVYRVEVDGEGPVFMHFLERKNKEWIFCNGILFADKPYRLKILEKYTKETK